VLASVSLREGQTDKRALVDVDSSPHPAFTLEGYERGRPEIASHLEPLAAVILDPVVDQLLRCLFGQLRAGIRHVRWWRHIQSGTEEYCEPKKGNQQTPKRQDPYDTSPR
jgi:hypothetical protein